MSTMNQLHEIENAFNAESVALHANYSEWILSPADYHSAMQRLQSRFDKDYKDMVALILTRQELYS